MCKCLVLKDGRAEHLLSSFHFWISFVAIHFQQEEERVKYQEETVFSMGWCLGSFANALHLPCPASRTKDHRDIMDSSEIRTSRELTAPPHRVKQMISFFAKSLGFESTSSSPSSYNLLSLSLLSRFDASLLENLFSSVSSETCVRAATPAGIATNMTGVRFLKIHINIREKIKALDNLSFLFTKGNVS